MKLFTYGTLMDAAPSQVMRSLANARGTTVENLGPATIRGTIYDLGYFPALTDGTGVVHGELFEIPDNLVERIDRYESAPGYYTRKAVRVLLGGVDVDAEAYFINRQPDESQRIDGGDWIKYMNAKGRS